MSKQTNYRFGIIGTGMIAEFHAKAIQAIPNAHLVAAYNHNPDKARDFANRHGCDSYDNMDAFLQADTNIVCICTPSGAHLEPGIAVAKSGKHVVVEKPVEVHLSRLDSLIQCCKDHGVQLIAIFQRRFNPAVQLLKTAIEDQRFGNLALGEASIRWWRNQAYYDSAQWRGTWKLDGGGALMNQGIHTIDLLIYLLGDVKQVSAYTGCVAHEGIEVEDVAVAIVEFQSGVKGIIQGTTSCWSEKGHPADIKICGDRGNVTLSDDRFQTWEFMEEAQSDTDIRDRFGLDSQRAGAGAADPSAIDFTWHQRNLEDALDAIDTGRPAFTNGIEGRRAVELIRAIYHSAQHGGAPVQLPFKESTPCI